MVFEILGKFSFVSVILQITLKVVKVNLKLNFAVNIRVASDNSDDLIK